MKNFRRYENTLHKHLSINRIYINEKVACSLLVPLERTFPDGITIIKEAELFSYHIDAHSSLTKPLPRNNNP